MVKRSPPATKEDVRLIKEDVRLLKKDVDVLKNDVRLVKEDVRLLKKDVGVLKDDVQLVKEDVRLLKNDVGLLAEQLGKYQNITERRIAESEARLIRHFDVAVEQIRADVAGANTDEILVIEERVSRIERHVGLTS